MCVELMLFLILISIKEGFCLADFETELKLGFLEEAEQAISDVEQSFLALEANPNDTENINKIFRLAHNLKGSSKAVGFDEFGAFTHQFESFILKVKNGELKATASIINLLLKANDHVSEMVQTLKLDLNAKLDSSAVLFEFENYKEESLPKDEPPPLVSQNSEFDQAEASSKGIKAEEGASEEYLPAPTAVAAKITPSPAAAASKTSAGPEESIRVGLNKVENLINFVGEMTILHSVLREQITATESPLIKKTVHQLGKVSKEIQDLTMGLRMIPLKPTFQKMQRIVRDTSKTLDKVVHITLSGEDSELDKTVLEKINDPLVHLIRNSVDHGIESADLRIQRGKSPQGMVHLKAYHFSGKLVIEVSDDGGGLDPHKLKSKAVEKGILKPHVEITETEAFQLIFAPGFSTKEQITDVSGRGVGMDVVRTNITDLGGEIQIDSELGKGTTFRILLPLTLAIVDAMVMNYSEHRFVIPINHVYETLKPDLKMIQSNTNTGDTLMLRGENLPILRLGDFFAIKSHRPAHSMIAMVIRSGTKAFALLVDDIVGRYQIVIKQLGPDLQHIKGISGSTILGDGKPALILEPQDLIKRKIFPSYQNPSPNTGGAAA